MSRVTGSPGARAEPKAGDTFDPAAFGPRAGPSLAVPPAAVSQVWSVSNCVSPYQHTQLPTSFGRRLVWRYMTLSGYAFLLQEHSTVWNKVWNIIYRQGGTGRDQTSDLPYR